MASIADWLASMPETRTPDEIAHDDRMNARVPLQDYEWETVLHLAAKGGNFNQHNEGGNEGRRGGMVFHLVKGDSENASKSFCGNEPTGRSVGWCWLYENFSRHLGQPTCKKCKKHLQGLHPFCYGAHIILIKETT